MGAGDEWSHDLFQDLVTITAKTELLEKTLIGCDGGGEGTIFLQFGVDGRTVELIQGGVNERIGVSRKVNVKVLGVSDRNVFAGGEIYKRVIPFPDGDLVVMEE